MDLVIGFMVNCRWFDELNKDGHGLLYGGERESSRVEREGEEMVVVMIGVAGKGKIGGGGE
jgi:hypothetical protein